MADKIRLGIIGANIHRGWAPRAHLPAVVASPEFELTAVCTTRQESAEESRQKFGARLAFDDYRKMLAHPDIDAVVVSLRVPSHYEPTMAALNAGKHVYTEWPLGQTTAEAQEMADLAQAKGVRNMVGLQARANPGILYAKDLVESGYVGDVMSCHVSRINGGVLQRTSDRTWQREVDLGANTLTIACGHTIDALRFVVGNFSHVSSVVSTQAKEWLEVDTKQMVDVSSPDNILVSGKLANGGVGSVHIASNPWAGSGYRMEIYGREGTLIVSSEGSANTNVVRIQGVREGNTLEDLEIPEKYVYVLEGMPQGEAYNVGQMYYQFGQSILSGNNCQPDFQQAVELHRFIDNIRQASDQGREVVVDTA
ncbi:MAG: Gfo/Idh/MocA family oxidoreductase [Chloroflexi bacterium]|nr:Gfo/Idh/MocA family oxidoreductase [Chloroflexota bacterium]MCH8350087.1 Gfo/Idh/MocA family oxidoreductase [Chloroflexota bacterium]MCI0792032.1 Gfo/Idh/MocA family oxidoreductase [Chloroflexota bacterium]MCI0823171.1 Gfo/Idh/MocA family oxidoreductase [Chloroflexota bacterium]MCI0857349.1 Gfo/Idh/MocA family oxidoreductase [Chloroflexota bacterium]